VRDRVDRKMTRKTSHCDEDGMRREQASYRPAYYGMRAQDHGALLASLARKVNALVDSHFRAGMPIFRAMPHKSTELPPKISKAFVRDMRAFHAEAAIKREAISSRQLVALNEYLGPQGLLRVETAGVLGDLFLLCNPE
jgi:hypothetical protein